MALRTINQAQSAYVHFTLSAGYFLDFMPQQGRSASIKLHLKNMVSIFRSAAPVETVWLQLAVDTECYLRVQLVCKNGVTKMFDLKFEEVRPQRQHHPAPARRPTLAHSSSPPPPPRTGELDECGLQQGGLLDAHLCRGLPAAELPRQLPQRSPRYVETPPRVTAPHGPPGGSRGRRLLLRAPGSRRGGPGLAVAA